MVNDEGRQGSRPGQTFQAMRQKARAGQLAGPRMPHGDSGCCYPGTGRPTPTNVGTGRTTVTRSPIQSPSTGNDPFERPFPRKPGAA